MRLWVASLVFMVTRALSQDLFSSFQQTRQSVRQMSEGLEAPLTLFSLFPSIPVFHHHPSCRSKGLWPCLLAVTLLHVLFTAPHISPEGACSMSDTDTHTQTHRAICYHHGNSEDIFKLSKQRLRNSIGRDGEGIEKEEF